MHIAPYENLNKPIVDVDNEFVPLNYFNIIKLKRGEVFEYSVNDYETCIVPAICTVSVDVGSTRTVPFASSSAPISACLCQSWSPV